MNEKGNEMNRFECVTRPLMWFTVLLMAALTAGCGGGGGGQGPILGSGGAVSNNVAPTVTAIAPLPNTTGVPVNTKIIAAAFSKPMNVVTLTPVSFSLACSAANKAGVVGSPKTLVAGGAVTYVAAGNVATLTLPGSLPAADLPASADCTATITTAANDTTGLALVSNFAWTFTTGIARDLTPPRVTLTAPATSIPGPTAVPIGTAITATFSKDIAPATINATSFTLTCAAPCAAPAGTVLYAVGSRTATFTPAAPLAPSTLYTATIKGIGASVVTDTVAPPNTLAGNTAPLAGPSDYTWSFTTGLVPDTTKPRVTLTVPATTIPGPTPGVPTNSAITATFTEAMAPLTINGASFTVTCAAPCVSPAGGVSYIGTTATFTPTTVPLAAGTYTATITTAATDLAGNALAGNQAALPAASNYVWTFTAVAPVPPAPVTVLSTNPVTAAPGVCPNASINATFNVPSGLQMDPLTINSANFTVTGPAPAVTAVTAATVLLDAPTGKIATFTPLNVLPVGVYTATIKGGITGVKDLAIPANAMAVDYNTPAWTFTVVPATGACLAPIALGAAAPFGFFSSAALTNQGTNPNTIINGDVGTTGVASSITGLHDTLGRTYTETCPSGIAAVGCGLVNGTIYASDAPVGGPAGVVAPAAAAALVAFNAMSPAGTPGGLDVTVNSLVGAGGTANELGGRTLIPGVYYSVAGPGAPANYQITTGNLTLDAQGNPNAVWIFQTAAGTGTLLVSSPTGPVLTVPRTVNLINGAQAKNVFWYVPAGAVINTGSSMVGTMIANASITFGTATGANPVIITTLNGRALVMTAGATMVNTVINVPAP
jgi:hypothetical protein